MIPLKNHKYFVFSDSWVVVILEIRIGVATSITIVVIVRRAIVDGCEVTFVCVRVCVCRVLCFFNSKSN